MANNYGRSDVYFATLPKEEIARELSARVDEWYTHIAVSGIFSRMKKCYNYYYGMGKNGSGNSSEISQGGVQGELQLIKVNHYRNLLQHMLIMTTTSRPSMDARAINSDYRSMAQTVLANGILDYYLREKRLERYLRKATEISLVFGEAFIRMEWDATQGEEFSVNPDTGRPMHSGDLSYSVINPLDIVKDLYQDDPEKHDWIIVRHFKNKFDIIAKYPELADEIVRLETKEDKSITVNFYKSTGHRSDLIPVYEFYHRKSDALPDGRQVVFLSSDVVLFDGPLPYKDIPVYRIAPGDFIGTSQGYTVAFDLVSIQEAIDALYSTVLTNQSTFGVQNIMLPKGHGISLTSLSGGLNLIEYDSQVGKPEALNLTNTPPEIFNFIKILESTLETISGVNSVARGNPEASLRSGNSLALIQSMAIQFNSGLQQSYAQLLEDVGTATITTLRDFADVPRIAMIVGKNNRTFAKEFTGNDLDKINRVVVDMGNPLAKTTSGKVQMAENMLQQGLIKTPQEYFQVIKTGQIEPLTEGPYSEIMLIRNENERLADGKPVKAMITDDHLQHIIEHKTVIANSDVRDPGQDQSVAQVTTDHIMEHINLLRNGDPELLKLLGQQPLAQPGQAPQGAPGGAPQGGPGGPPPQGGPQPGPAPANPTNAPEMSGQNPSEPQSPGQPSMPKNPLTGQKANPGGQQ